MEKKLALTGLSAVLASMLLVGCGSSSSSNKSSGGKNVSGVVSDGKIKNASVSLYEVGSDNALETVTSGSDGSFSFNTKVSTSKKYMIIATGGTDVDTGEEFKGVSLKAPLEMFTDSSLTVVSPLTTLVAEEMLSGSEIDPAMEAIKEKLGLELADLGKDPSDSTLDLQRKAMKLSLMAKEGVDFSTIRGLLDNDGDIDDADIDNATGDEAVRAKLKDVFAALDSATAGNIASKYTEGRYLREIIASGTDLNISDPVQLANLKTLAEDLFGRDGRLSSDDIVATFGEGIEKADVNMSTGFDPATYSIIKVAKDIQFSDSLKTAYYEIDNPKTNNQQLIAFNYDTGDSHVVNTNVILKDKVFIYEGEKSGDMATYTGKAYGLYLDPEQESETRVGTSRYGTEYTYSFYSDNALMKFNPSNPTDTSYIFQSSQLPQALKDAGIAKLGNDYSVFENIVDVDNSYVVLDGFDSLADTIKLEDEKEKKFSAVTVRMGDSTAIAGDAVAIVKDANMKTAGLLVSYTAPYIPADGAGSYELRLYNSALTSFSKVADGSFHYASQNDSHIYLYKNGSNKLWAMAKSGSTLDEVTGMTLAGDFDSTIHSQTSRHGQTGTVLTGASTLSGRNLTVSDGTNAYVAFDYDLQDNTNDIFVFGSYGAYKHSQIFKLTGTSGSKVFDNGDGSDDPLNPANTEENKGHVNLIAVASDKLYVETGWNDGNATLGGTCTTGYPFGTNGKGCFKLKYGYVDTTSPSPVTDTTVLSYDNNDDNLDRDMTVSGIPYYVSRRVAPLAADGKLYVSLFSGGTSSTGYIHKLYTFDLGQSVSTAEKEGRTYFVKSGTSASGEFSGDVISWSKTTSTVTKPDGTVVGDTASLTDGGRSVSALTSGVPLAGIGTIGMLKNDKGGHNFELFTVDASSSTDSFKAVDLAPFGGWIYE